MSSNHHIVPFNVYIKVLSALLILTVLTVLVAQMDFGTFNVLIAMGIATIKATLVLLFFMHLKYDNKLFPVIFLTGVFFLVVIFLFCEFDIITRVPEFSVL
jgi:cytochrome c oxidase subunit 4